MTIRLVPQRCADKLLALRTALTTTRVALCGRTISAAGQSESDAPGLGVEWRATNTAKPGQDSRTGIEFYFEEGEPA